MALNSLLCAHVPLRNCSLTHAVKKLLNQSINQSAGGRRISNTCCDITEILYVVIIPDTVRMLVVFGGEWFVMEGIVKIFDGW